MTKLLSRAAPVAPVAQRADRALRPIGFYDCRSAAGAPGHDRQTKVGMARLLAELLGVDYAGEIDAARLPRTPLLLVPSETLESVEQARQLGIVRPDHLFGGVVPHRFVATKVITHPLVRAGATAPAGWSASFGDAVRDVVLPGYSSFTPADAIDAGERLLHDGAVRLKRADGVGGSGQCVVESGAGLRARVAAIDPELLRRDGVVLERNLGAGLTTRSVGQVCVGPWLASYCGTQQLVRNHRGNEVYGGSRLMLVRGGYDALLGLALDPAERLAVDQARTYDRRAKACFVGLMASRSNYDIAQGLDTAGRLCSGVLEQSWRIGGASGAEILALHAFREDPGRRLVRASTHEVYADEAAIPDGARVYFDGRDDAGLGRLTKYALVERDGDA